MQTQQNSLSNSKEAEQRLNAEQAKFEAIFYGAESPLVIFKGPEFIFEMFNEKYQQIYPKRELLGRTLLEAVPELKETRFPEILKKVYENGEHYISHEGMVRIKNFATGLVEDRYFDTTFSRISYGEGKPYRIMGTPREVTDRVNERKKMEASLLELQKERELRNRFVSALTHDLRTPLAIARVGAQILKRKSADPESVNSLADRIVLNIDHAVRMIHDLLDANSITVGKGIPLTIQECRMDLIAIDTVSSLEELYGKKFEIQNKAGEIHGYWDPMGIHRLIENLASNAIKYGTPETKVTITLEVGMNWVEIAVHNFGNPITLAEQAELFCEYRRTLSAIKSGQKGWGIGLALVKGLTEAHKGSVRIESDSIHGTTFFARLPLDARES